MKKAKGVKYRVDLSTSCLLSQLRFKKTRLVGLADSKVLLSIS